MINKDDFYINVSKAGKYILYTGIENGQRVRKRVEYNPTLFLPSKDKNSIYRTISNQPVEPFKPGDMNECREFISKYSGVDNFNIYGMDRFQFSFIHEHFPDDVKWVLSHIKVANIDIEVSNKSGMSIDEMLQHAQDEVTAITIHYNGKFHVFGCKAYKPKSADVVYYHCENEKDLLERFLALWTADYPDAVTGWNIKFFDFPYLINRMNNILGETTTKKLSPWNRIGQRTVTMMNKDHSVYDMVGIGLFDGLELYRKFAPGGTARESFKLDYIASVEVGEKKINYTDYKSLDQLYHENYEMFIDYNIKDVDLVEKVLKKHELIKLGFILAYQAKVNYDDIFFQVRMWDSMIYGFLKNRNIVIPQRKINRKEEAYGGAYVKDVITGKHGWTISFDLKSLYPHLQMQYCISPDTFIDPSRYSKALWSIVQNNVITVDNLLDRSIDLSDLKTEHVTITPNGQFFSTKKQGFLPEMLEDMYKKRDHYKSLSQDAKAKVETTKDSKEKERLKELVSEYDTLQQVVKICLNSAYGAVGNQFFRFFDVRQAAAVTFAGQLSIRWIIKHVNLYMNKLLNTKDKDYILASDTDSIYINMDDLVAKFFPTDTQAAKHDKIVNFLDKVAAEQLTPFINNKFDELAKYVNAYQNRMEMKREIIADKSLWVKKKHYVLNVLADEKVRYAKPKIKVKGLQMIKSSTPTACREKLKDALELVMNGTEDQVIDLIDSFRSEFKKLPIEDIAFPRGMSEMEDFGSTENAKDMFGNKNSGGDIFKKGTPIHVKASLLYNKALDDLGLKMYAKLQDGEKIKYVYLRKPNPYFSDIMGFPGFMPKELKIEQYIDWDTQFEKAFVSPLKSILDVIPWATEKSNSLFD